MAKIVLPISDGFEEIEAISIIDVCRRAGIEVVIAAVQNIVTVGAHNLKVTADCKIEDIKESDFDMIVLPGGQPNADTLAANEHVQSLLKQFKQEDKNIAAICAAPYALHTAGVLSQNYTCYPSFEKKIRQDGYQEKQIVVVDDKVITSKGPGTAICFALEIVKTFCDEKTYTGLKKGLLAECC